MENRLVTFYRKILDGEWEAQWLVTAGFPQLTRAFEQVRMNKIAIERRRNLKILIDV